MTNKTEQLQEMYNDFVSENNKHIDGLIAVYMFLFS